MPSTGATGHQASGVEAKLAVWLEHLRVIVPPRGLVHIGAGSGTEVSSYSRWTVPRVVLIDADSDSVKRLRLLARGEGDWEVRHALVSRSAGEARFNVVSSPRENGLLPVEASRNLWRNLQLVAERVMQTTTVDDLLGTDGAANWLVVDCLPAVAVLEGAARSLKHCDVVVARAELGGETTAGRGTTLSEIEALLGPMGFRCLAVEEERMPLIGRCLFFRGSDTAQRAQLEEVSIQLAVHKDRVATIEEDQQRQQQRIEAAATEMGALQASLDASRQSEAAAVERVAAAGEQQRILQAENASLRESQAAVAQAAQALRSELGSLNSVSAELRRTHASQLAELETLQAALKEQAERLQQAEQQSTSDRAQAESLRLHAEACDSHLELARAEIVALQQSKVAVSAQQSEQRAELDEAARQLARRTRQLSECNAFLAERDTRIGSLESLGASLQANVDRLTALVRWFEAQVAEHAAQLEARDAQLNQSTEQLLQTQSESEATGRLAVEQAERSSALMATREQTIQQLTGELARVTALVEEGQRRLSRADANRQYFDIEMAKAEAQIGLIRDLLLRQA